MIDVKENEDGTFTINWDENDPNESKFNDWTEKDFINLIQDYLNSLQESGVIDDIGGEEVLAESVNEVTEYFIDQTPEEVQQDIRNAEKFLNFNSKNVQESNYEGFNQGPEDYKLS